jgi:GcrA cell cycle regulator
MRSTNSEFEWTDDRIRKLRQLWSEGHSTAEIGRRMGVSKNAVVGKAHRLDLPARPSPIRTGSSPRPARAPRRQPVPRLADTMPLPCLRDADAPTPVERIAPTVEPARHVAITPQRIGSHPCCWPIGEPGTPAFRFCDAAALVGRPYCNEHARLAYRRPSRREIETITVAQGTPADEEHRRHSRRDVPPRQRPPQGSAA